LLFNYLIIEYISDGKVIATAGDDGESLIFMIDEE